MLYQYILISLILSNGIPLYECTTFYLIAPYQWSFRLFPGFCYLNNAAGGSAAPLEMPPWYWTMAAMLLNLSLI